MDENQRGFSRDRCTQANVMGRAVSECLAEYVCFNDPTNMCELAMTDDLIVRRC